MRNESEDFIHKAFKKLALTNLRRTPATWSYLKQVPYFPKQVNIIDSIAI